MSHAEVAVPPLIMGGHRRGRRRRQIGASPAFRRLETAARLERRVSRTLCGLWALSLEHRGRIALKPLDTETKTPWFQLRQQPVCEAFGVQTSVVGPEPQAPGE